MQKWTRRSYGAQFSDAWDPFVYVSNRAGPDLDARAGRTDQSWRRTTHDPRRRDGALPGGRHKRTPLRLSALLAQQKSTLARWILAWRVEQAKSAPAARGDGPHLAYDIDHLAGSTSSGESVEHLGIGAVVLPRAWANPHKNQGVFNVFNGDSHDSPGVTS